MQYYKANEAFEIRKSERTKREARRWLSEIRRLCSTRRVEIMDDFTSNKKNQNQEQDT
jgi:hypothetical protein